MLRATIFPADCNNFRETTQAAEAAAEARLATGGAARRAAAAAAALVAEIGSELEMAGVDLRCGGGGGLKRGWEFEIEPTQNDHSCFLIKSFEKY